MAARLNHPNTGSKMLKNHISLKNELIKAGDIYITNEKIGTGELILRKHFPPRVDVSNHPNKERSNIKSIQLSLHDQPALTLLECESYGNKIYPKAVIKSENHDGKFKRITIIMDGFSIWMNNRKLSEITDKKVTHYNPTNKFSVTVNNPALGELQIYCDNWIETYSCEPNSIKIIQHTPITIEAKSQNLTCENVIELTNKIRNILSILIGYKLTISYCFDSSRNNLCSMYFSSAQEDSIQFEHRVECLANANKITTKMWEGIFRSSFEERPDNFNNLWSQLPNLKGFSKNWEYGILACVTLIEGYSNIFSERHSHTLSDSKLRKLKKQLKSSVDTFHFEETPNKNTSTNQIISNIKSQIDLIEGSSLQTFEQCFKFTYESTIRKFGKILNFTEEEFRHIKKIRNKIAHGDRPKTKVTLDITHEMTIQAKITLILYYWALTDFGFSEMDCIGILGNWQHPTVRAANIDRTALDKTLKKIKFFPLDKDDFTTAKEQTLTICIEYLRESRTYKYNSELSSEAERWDSSIDSCRASFIEEHLTKHVNTKKIQTISYIGPAYIENGTDSHLTFGVCVLNPPKRLVDKNRSWTYDYEDKKWCTSSRYIKRRKS